MKKCSICNEEKSLEDFRKWYTYCKKCTAKKRKLSRNRKRENAQAVKRRYENPEKDLVRRAKDRARLKNLPFDLTIEDIDIPKRCPILNIKIESHIGLAKANSISIDRIVPELGYIKGNIRIISKLANSMKQNATLEQMEVFCSNILNYMKENERNKRQNTKGSSKRMGN